MSQQNFEYNYYQDPKYQRGEAFLYEEAKNKCHPGEYILCEAYHNDKPVGVCHSLDIIYITSFGNLLTCTKCYYTCTKCYSDPSYHIYSPYTIHEQIVNEPLNDELIKYIKKTKFSSESEIKNYLELIKVTVDSVVKLLSSFFVAKEEKAQ